MVLSGVKHLILNILNINMENKQARAEFLQAILTHDGSANTTEIRTEIGFTRTRMNYWYSTLEDEGLINIEYDREGRRVAVITDEGKEQVRKGNFGKEVLNEDQNNTTEITLSRNDFVELVERVERLENQNQALQERLQDQEQKQDYLLVKMGKLRIMIEGFRRLFEDDYPIYEKMDDVETEAIQSDDLDPDIKQYKNDLN
jgi:predicted transcriptional regulator/uncharacterized protein (UPF0335 family)